MGFADSIKVLVMLAARGITSHRVKSLIVGGILAFGTFLLVLGSSLLGNIERAMEQSITNSLIGHLQVYSDKAKDQLAFYGPNAANDQDLGVIEDFAKTREVLEKVPNVKAVVPMGRSIGTLVGGNHFDELLGSLREAVQAKDHARQKALITQVRQIAGFTKEEQTNRLALATNTAEIKEAIAKLEKVTSDAFWAEFDAHPLETLELLDTQIAPLQSDQAAIMVMYVGTDVQRFAKEFSHFEIVSGQMIPPGERGFLFNQGFYDETAKNKVAKLLDQVMKDRKKGKTFASDPKLKEKADRIPKQYRSVLLDLAPENTRALEEELRKILPAEKGDLGHLLQAFLKVDEESFDQRFKQFYELVAPKIRLYKVKVGDMVTIRVFTNSGYTRAANIKLWGTFRFKGLDESILASRVSLADIMTFRDLYGLMTPERRKELEAIRAQVGVKDVAAEDAEAALFGDASQSIEREQAAPAEQAPGEATEQAKEIAVAPRPYTQDDIDRGVVLNAAVVLEDGAKMRKTQWDIMEASKRGGLGLNVMDWQTASAILGQFIFAMRVLLFVVIGIIFVVALIIINNSMLMATMDRIQEIGTMRAIGAQRRFVLVLFLLETVVLSALSSVVGILAAGGVLALMHRNGIPATHDALVVLFGGPRLYPTLSASSVVVGVTLIGIVSFIATLYPAFIATRIAPVVAMQRRE